MKINKEKVVTALWTVLIVGVIGLVMYAGDILALFKPVRGYDYVLDNGLRAGNRIEGEIYYSLGCFASETTT